MGACQSSRNKIENTKLPYVPYSEYQTKQISEWDTEDVYEWISTLNNGDLHDLAIKFKKRKINGKELQFMDNKSLIRMKVSIGDRLDFLKSLRMYLQQRQNNKHHTTEQHENELSVSIANEAIPNYQMFDSNPAFDTDHVYYTVHSLNLNDDLNDDLNLNGDSGSDSDSDSDYVWQWEDDYFSWHCYDDKITRTLEEIDIDHHIIYKCKQNNETYKITKMHYHHGEQVNMRNNIRRRIRRIKQTLLSDADDDGVKYPIFWDKYFVDNDEITNYSKCKLLPLNNANNSAESQFVINRFHQTVHINNYEIINIECVQNKYLWDRYFNAKEILMKNFGNNSLNEMYLFHGTATTNNDNVIMTEGFNQEFATNDIYGEGIYFAKDANYYISHSQQINNSNSNSNGNIFRLFLCAVICGEMSVGHQNIKLQDWPTKNNGIIYDSLVNKLPQPNIFVIHEHVRTYPMFIIDFKRK